MKKYNMKEASAESRAFAAYREMGTKFKDKGANFSLINNSNTGSVNSVEYDIGDPVLGALLMGFIDDNL